MTLLRIFLLVLVAAAGALCTPAIACSMSAPLPLVTTGDGRLEPVRGLNDLVVWARVVAHPSFRPDPGRPAVTALAVRVLESDNGRVVAGEEILFHLFTVGSPDCSPVLLSFRPEDYPVDSTLRIVAKGTAIPKWEARHSIQVVR